MKLFSVILVLFLVFSDRVCAMHKASSSRDEVMDVINSYLKPLESKKQIKLRGYGLHYAGQDKIYDGKIHEIDLSISIDKGMRFNEARELYYSVVDGLLEAINKKPSIRDYFYHYPVTYQDLYFRLNFDYEDKGYLNRDDISMIAILENEIMYFILEEDGRKARMEMRKINPDVYCGTGFSPKTRCVTKKLPEEAIND